MDLVLNIYTDETLSEIKRTVQADKLKIPYRVAMYIVQSIDTIDINNENDLLKLITGNTDKVDKIIKATFGVSDSELECIDVAELGAVAKEVYTWGLEKINSLDKGGQEKNA